MPKQKNVVVISPEYVKENLSTDEWQALVNIIDKLLIQGVKLDITYTEISTTVVPSYPVAYCDLEGFRQQQERKRS